MNQPLFKTDLLIQVADINYGGHLGNDRFLTLAQEVRVRWLKSLGLDERGLILVEANLKFLKEVFWGETLTAELNIEQASKCALTLTYTFIEKDSQQTASEISTKIAFFDYSKRKIVKMPETIIHLIKNRSV